MFLRCLIRWTRESCLGLEFTDVEACIPRTLRFLLPLSFVVIGVGGASGGHLVADVAVPEGPRTRAEAEAETGVGDELGSERVVRGGSGPGWACCYPAKCSADQGPGLVLGTCCPEDGTQRSAPQLRGELPADRRTPERGWGRDRRGTSGLDVHSFCGTLWCSG